jgi:hypothetical protein
MEKKLNNKEVLDVLYLYNKAEMWVTRYTPRKFTVREMIPEIEEQVTEFEGKYLYKYKLLLKDLSQISDEDAVEVAKIFRSDIYWGHISVEPSCIKISGVLGGIDHCTLTIWNDMDFDFSWFEGTPATQPDNNYSYKLREFLKSRGYAVPLWFGIDHPCNGMTALELGLGISEHNQ